MKGHAAEVTEGAHRHRHATEAGTFEQGGERRGGAPGGGLKGDVVRG